ncbi:hypothetical protein GCM10009555_069490 [Acrocarpospora macrocephala]|uniref:ABC transporter permease n=1 Tax=Acrocarpospora macrocephala TaxID=150177 RepID=A0A5M3X312_9ACTN|nr:ABC transporter permease subunit [Acrocarpospora macrocephala]GES16127.1 hypothetical protein Amac_097250 [Acrocarpospora macrocephala]
MSWLAFRQHRGRMIGMGLIFVLWGGLCGMELYAPVLSGMSAMVFAYIPLVFGVFLGAPIVSREYERGTHQFAWTQSVSRSQWFLWQVVVALSLALATTAYISTLVGFVTPEFTLEVDSVMYPLTGSVPYAWAVFAVATGLLWSAITRRTTVAMAAAFFGVAASQFIAEGMRNRSEAVSHWTAADIWILQSVEAGILVAIAGVMGLAAWWLTARRDPA